MPMALRLRLSASSEECMSSPLEESFELSGSERMHFPILCITRWTDGGQIGGGQWTADGGQWAEYSDGGW